MTERPKQLFFDLPPRDPFALEYFVTHSGVVAAYEQLERVMPLLQSAPERFSMIVIFGPASSGKTHLLKGFAALAAQSQPERLATFDFSHGVAEGEDSRFVSEYERLRTEGGILLVETRVHPSVVTDNPHVRSRLLAGELVSIDFPADEELKPLLRSILERRNVRISDRILDYLITRLPRDLLSFDSIFDKIDELSFNESRRLGLGVVRDAVKG